MIVTLKNGSTIQCEDEPFAQGTDGAAHWSSDAGSLVKLYHQAEPWREAALDLIVSSLNAVKSAPYYAGLLCWPVGVVKLPRLGVVLPRAEQGLEKLAKMILPKYLNYHQEYVGRWDARVTMALRLARAVRRMHTMGLCHSDLSDNNILANASDGRVYVIDCDGLVVPGRARHVVVGTKFFMAPEVVAGTAGPSVLADQHALAVLIYHLLFLRHPLRGVKVHAQDADRNETLQLGEKGLYIEHPADLSNRPEHLGVPSMIAGSAVTRLFNRAFVDGLHTPGARPPASTWERDLAYLLDTLLPCPNPQCSFKSFPLPEVSTARVKVACPWCKTALRGWRMPVLRWRSPVPDHKGGYSNTSRRKVARDGETLHEWHVRAHVLPGDGVSTKALGHFARHRRADGSDCMVLVNDCLPYLEAADPGNSWKRIRAGEAAELKQGRTLRFGPPGTAPDIAVEIVELA